MDAIIQYEPYIKSVQVRSLSAKCAIGFFDPKIEDINVHT